MTTFPTFPKRADEIESEALESDKQKNPGSVLILGGVSPDGKNKSFETRKISDDDSHESIFEKSEAVLINS